MYFLCSLIHKLLLKVIAISSKFLITKKYLNYKIKKLISLKNKILFLQKHLYDVNHNYQRLEN